MILLGAAVLAHSAVDLVVRPVGAAWFILVALTVISGWAALRVPATLISFSISDTFSIAAALLFGPAAGAVTAALDGLVLSYRMSISRRTVHRVLFNMAAPAVGTWAAAQVFFALAGDRPLLEGPFAAVRLLTLLTVFCALDFAFNTGIVARAVSFEQRRPVLVIWREHFVGFWVTYLGGVFAAMLVMVLSHLAPLDIVVLIAPLPVLVYITFRHALGRAEDQIGHLGKLNKVYVAAIEALAHAIDAKDQVTHDHIRRVQDQSVRLARVLGVRDEVEIEAIKAASLLHDVGKIAIPEHILNKPGRLSASEYEIMKRHAAIGADILSMIDFPYPVVPIVRHHHESWDGGGYPDGVSGERIPIGARILAVVDCFDALTSDRPYRPRLDDRDALQILAERSGSMYDPAVIEAFFALHGADLAAATLPAPPPAPLASTVRQAPSAPAKVEGDDTLLLMFCEIGRGLEAAASPEQIGATLWSNLRRHVPASAFVLFAYDAGSDALVVLHEAGDTSTGLAGARIQLGERLSGWVAATGQSILNSDARLDLNEDTRDGTPLRSALAVPIFSGDRVTGVLSFYAREENAFDDTHRRLVHTAAHAVAGTVARVAPATVTAAHPQRVLQRHTRT